MSAGLTWKRDGQGLHAEAGDLIVYVRRVDTGWRSAFSETVEISGLRVADVSKPMETIDVADTQRLAKAVAEAFADEPWSDGSAQRRSTRAVLRAYESAS